MNARSRKLRLLTGQAIRFGWVRVASCLCAFARPRPRAGINTGSPFPQTSSALWCARRALARSLVCQIRGDNFQAALSSVRDPVPHAPQVHHGEQCHRALEHVFQPLHVRNSVRAGEVHAAVCGEQLGCAPLQRASFVAATVRRGMFRLGLLTALRALGRMFSLLCPIVTSTTMTASPCGFVWCARVRACVRACMFLRRAGTLCSCSTWWSLASSRRWRVSRPVFARSECARACVRACVTRIAAHRCVACPRSLVELFLTSCAT
jgi:hypothetical protein